MSPIRCAVFGAGHFGRYHAQKYAATAGADLVAVVAAPAGLAKACAWATTIVTTLEVWRDCAAPAWILDRATILREGAIEVRLLPGGEIAIRTTRSMRGARPWSSGASPRAAAAEEEPQ